MPHEGTDSGKKHILQLIQDASVDDCLRRTMLTVVAEQSFAMATEIASKTA